MSSSTPPSPNPPASSPTTLILRRNNNTLVSDNLANTTLWVQGHGFVADAVRPTGTTSRTTVTIAIGGSPVVGNYASNVATNGHTLTNAADGTLEVIGDGGGGPRFLWLPSIRESLTSSAAYPPERVVRWCQFAAHGRHSEWWRHAPGPEWLAVTIDGGTITTQLALVQDGVTFDPTSTVSGTVTLSFNNSLAGTVPASATVWVQGHGGIADSNLSWGT